MPVLRSCVLLELKMLTCAITLATDAKWSLILSIGVDMSVVLVL